VTLGIVIVRNLGFRLGASIMSPIPKTAPFADDEIEILNQVVARQRPSSALARGFSRRP